jgi:hypothetical protein
MNKYNAVKTMYDGIKFDSQLESIIYRELKRMLNVDTIQALQLQIPYILHDKFTNCVGRKIQAIKYVADFVITKDNVVYVIDVKGMILSDFKLKMKLFEFRYNMQLHIVKTVSDVRLLLL